MYPRLYVNLEKLRQNGEKLCTMAASGGMRELAFVTKCFCANPEMIRALEPLPFSFLADSRVENLAAYPETRKQKLLLRLPMISQAAETVRWADLSLCSEEKTLEALELAAAAQGRRHKVILMVDMGDLREGVFFREEDRLLSLAETAEQAQHLIFYGMAFNLTCYGSVIPTAQTLADFRALAARVEQRIGKKLPFLSAGNSSSLYLLEEGADFSGYTNLRLGESLLLGRETAFGAELPGLHPDVLTLEAELIEVQQKPSFPIGLRGRNAFGEQVEYEDHGIRRRGIAAIGQQDICWDGLKPVDPRISVIGASSDHLLLDLTQTEYTVGDLVRFRPDYGAALRAFTSPYVEKVMCK